MNIRDSIAQQTPQGLASEFRSTKAFHGYPCAHSRAHHDGHCRFIHGYSRSFHFEFACNEREAATGFVQEFGGLKWMKELLADWFDHTLLVDAEDPDMDLFKEIEASGRAKLTVLPDVGMEGTALWLYEQLDPNVRLRTAHRVWISRIEVRENEKNSGIFIPALS